jgi:hypothetical protein
MRKLYVPVGSYLLNNAFSTEDEEGSLNEKKANQNIARKSESE